jgi:hypothetical protein
LLSVFNGTTPNWTWSLYVVDDGAGDQGSFASGWSISINTVASAGDVAGPVASAARLRIVRKGGAESIKLMIEGVSERQYVVETSEDLKSWTPLGVVQLKNGSGSFTDPEAASLAGRFYRARELP